MDKVWIRFPELGHKLAQDKAKRSRRATHAHTREQVETMWVGTNSQTNGKQKKKKRGNRSVTCQIRRVVLKNKAGGHETTGQKNKIDKT